MAQILLGWVQNLIKHFQWKMNPNTAHWNRSYCQYKTHHIRILVRWSGCRFIVSNADTTNQIKSCHTSFQRVLERGQILWETLEMCATLSKQILDKVVEVRLPKPYKFVINGTKLWESLKVERHWFVPRGDK